MSRCLACGRAPLPRNLSPVRHAGQRPAGDRKRRFQACSSPFFATLMPAPVAASTRARPWPLPVCRTCPARGPGPAARDCIKPQRRRLRDDISTVKTTYRLLRLATMLLLMQTAWPTRDATLPALLAQFLPDGFCAHWELAGCHHERGNGTPSAWEVDGLWLRAAVREPVAVCTAGAKPWRRRGHRHGPGGRATRHDAIMAPAIRLRCGGMATYARPYHPAQ